MFSVDSSVKGEELHLLHSSGWTQQCCLCSIFWRSFHQCVRLSGTLPELKAPNGHFKCLELDMVSYMTGTEVAAWAIWQTLTFIVQSYRSIIHMAAWASILLLLLSLIYTRLQFFLRNKTPMLFWVLCSHVIHNRFFSWSVNDFMACSLFFCINIAVIYWMFGKVMSVGCYSTDTWDRGEGEGEGREKGRKTGRKENKIEWEKGKRGGEKKENGQLPCG